MKILYFQEENNQCPLIYEDILKRCIFTTDERDVEDSFKVNMDGTKKA